MDVLRQHGWRTALLCLALLVGACLLREMWQASAGPVFPHRVHVEEEGLDCAMCHSGASTRDDAGFPNSMACMLCHEDIDAEKPEDRRVESFYDEAGQYRASAVASVPDEVLFSHQNHVSTYGVSCEECHGKVGQSNRIPAESAVSKSECLDCHARAGRSNECQECHQEIDRTWQPPSHFAAWDRRHGFVAESPESGSANDCTQCHQESSCQACHQTEAPANHTNFWRLRGHGLSASLDRSRCATCHRTDSCDRCHQSTSPRSHLGGFGSPQNRHCVSCHFPLKNEGCFTCHKSNPSHLFAAPLPPDHNVAMNCRQCHGVTAPLPHPDKGDSCVACHR